MPNGIASTVQHASLFKLAWKFSSTASKLNIAPYLSHTHVTCLKYYNYRFSVRGAKKEKQIKKKLVTSI